MMRLMRTGLMVGLMIGASTAAIASPELPIVPEAAQAAMSYGNDPIVLAQLPDGAVVDLDAPRAVMAPVPPRRSAAAPAPRIRVVAAPPLAMAPPPMAAAPARSKSPMFWMTVGNGF